MHGPARVIQTFIRNCGDCPNAGYYSGGMYQCSLTTEMFTKDDMISEVAKHCPLPYAGPVQAPGTSS